MYISIKNNNYLGKNWNYKLKEIQINKFIKTFKKN